MQSRTGTTPVKPGGHLDAVAALELRPHHGVAATTPRHPLGKTIWAEISTAGSGSQLT
ncbi:MULTISPECIES: hypothetical protein [Streptomyces]|uniref:Uncharacterized protein n=1 Tax=Streptomyces galilaeus TaxID=33899 RepID=A0ABW9IC75_STRGJ